MITGLLNRHPEASMELMALPKDDPMRYEFGHFYEKMAGADT
jgi:hypothetical protein